MNEYGLNLPSLGANLTELSFAERTGVFRKPVCSCEQSIPDSAQAFESRSLYGEFEIPDLISN